MMRGKAKSAVVTVVVLVSFALVYARDRLSPGGDHLRAEDRLVQTQQGFCPPGRHEPMRITEDSIGYFPVDATLNRLIELCPAAGEPLPALDGSGLPTLTLPFPHDTAQASQNRASYDLTAGADLWMVTGSSAILPGGVPIDGTWHDLKSQYKGELEVTVETDRVAVRFCSLPQLFFELAVPSSYIVDRRGIPDAAMIPATARIQKVIVLAGVNREQAVMPERC